MAWSIKKVGENEGNATIAAEDPELVALANAANSQALNDAKLSAHIYAQAYQHVHVRVLSYVV